MIVKICVLARKMQNEIHQNYLSIPGKMNVAVSLPFVKNTPRQERMLKSCKAHTISNLPVAVKVPH